MIDLNILSEFSRNHCVGICAFLVPANLLSSSQILIFTGLERPRSQIHVMVAATIAYSTVMILHVLTWFMAGVVMAPTFILLFLGTVCLSISFWALLHSSSMANLLKSISFWVISKFKQRQFLLNPSNPQL